VNNKFDTLLPNIYFLQRGWYNSNHVLITGEEGAVLVDTGQREDVVEMLRLIAEAGVCLFVQSLSIWWGKGYHL